MRTKPRRPQRFVVSHHREKDFEGGLRSYAKYRDLGIVKATNGMVRAHVEVLEVILPADFATVELDERRGARIPPRGQNRVRAVPTRRG